MVTVVGSVVVVVVGEVSSADSTAVTDCGYRDERGTRRVKKKKSELSAEKMTGTM